MIVRGTTPYHSFLVPMAPEEIDEVYITYLQNEEVVLDKSKADVTIELVEEETENASIDESNGVIDYSNEVVDDESDDMIVYEDEQSISQITLHLTQEDTLKFKFFPAARKNIAVIQLRILDKNGEAYASDPVNERIFGVLKDGVISSNETH